MRRYTAVGVSAAAFAALGEVLVRWFQVPTYVVPAPSMVALRLWESRLALVDHTMATFSAASLGMLIALGLAALVAILVGIFRKTAPAMVSWLVLVQSTPVIAFGPVLSAWLGPGVASKAVLAAMICFPAMAATILSGLNKCPREEVLLYRSMGASPLKMFYLVRVPRSVPSVFTALSVGVPLSVLGAIVGEFVGASRGLGFYIMTASYYLRTTDMFAAILCAAVGSFILVSLVEVLRRQLSWEQFEAEGDDLSAD